MEDSVLSDGSNACLESLPRSISRLVFIAGIMHRSGTTFLRRLIANHPDCAQIPLPEDYLIYPLNHLMKYAETVQERYSEHWTSKRIIQRQLCEAMGHGLDALIDAQFSEEKKALILKSPSTRNIDLFFKFFPTAKLIILVRDGRSIAESAEKTFGWDKRKTAIHWRATVEHILRFDTENKREFGSQYRIIRYENLVDTSQKETLADLLKFLNLDINRYDFASIDSLPVFGSSVHSNEEDKWVPKAKPKNFNPLERFGDWDDNSLKEFNEIAGDAMEKIGYQSLKG